MWHDAHDAYLESRIESANPMELVRLLYQGATSAVRDARKHLAAGEIAARSRSISRAYAILSELAVSLDHRAGGDLSLRLTGLYDYMERRLLEANFQQADPPLVEVLGLLTTLGEAWDGIQTVAEPVEQAANPWTQAPPEAEPACVSGGWSL
jgi:flagellar secretion chaperone FliS